MRKLFVLLTVVAVVLGGAIVAVAANSPSSAEADDAAPLRVAALQDETDEAPTEDAPAAHAPGVIDAVLDELVADGVITQEQAEAVSDAFSERFAERDMRPRFRFREFGFDEHFDGFDEHLGGFDFGELPDLDRLRERLGTVPFELRGIGGHLDTIIDLLGGDIEAVFDGLADGKTLAEIAEANGVTPQQLIDAVVDAAREGLDDAVAADRLTQERADEMLARIAEAAEALINADIMVDGFGFGLDAPDFFGKFPFGGDDFRFGGDDVGDNAHFRFRINA